MTKKDRTTAKSPALDDEPLVKANGAYANEDEGMDEDEEEDEEDEDEEEEEDAEKADLTEATLLKALDEMDNLAKASANGISPRQAALASKLARGENLTKSEREEMARLVADEQSMTKSHKEQFMADPNIAQGFEVSDFLDAITSKVAEALDANRAELIKSFAEVGEFHRALAKSLNALGAAVLAQDKEIKALKAQLAKSTAPAREAAPAKGASAVGRKINDNIRKSDDGGVVLSRSAILSAFDELIEKSENRSGIVDGVDLVFESARYETTMQASPDAMRLVCKHRGIDPAVFGL